MKSWTQNTSCSTSWQRKTSQQTGKSQRSSLLSHMRFGWRRKSTKTSTCILGRQIIKSCPKWRPKLSTPVSNFYSKVRRRRSSHYILTAFNSVLSSSRMSSPISLTTSSRHLTLTLKSTHAVSSISTTTSRTHQHTSKFPSTSRSDLSLLRKIS